MIQISQTDAVELGIQPSIKASQDLGFTDFRKSSALTLKNAYLDLENLGVLRKSNPRLVVRKPINFIKTSSTEAQVWQSWRQVVEEEHYYAKYQVTTTLVGQLSDIHFPLSYYAYSDNNFFKPFKETKAVKRIKEHNDFGYARFRFPTKSSNTIDLTVQTFSGTQTLRPKFPGLLSKEEDRKTYYRWHPAATRFPSGQSQSPYDNLNLSGFNIPYPNTLSIYEGVSFNVPTKIAPKFNSDNSQSLNGLIVISTGDAEQKTICYVSPHALTTGFLNSIEDIYTENYRTAPIVSPGSVNLLTVERASWHGSSQTGFLGTCYGFGYTDNLNGSYKETTIPSQNNTHKRFVKADDHRKQIYFDNTISTPYGSGAWCIALSGSANVLINTGQKAVVYVHQPNSFLDWKKTDPRKLAGPWIAASGHPNAANAIFLNRAGIETPIVSQFKSCRSTSIVTTERLQIPSLLIDSKYTNSGHVLPHGIKIATRTYTSAIYPMWKLSNTTGLNASGYVINNAFVTMAQVLQSGIPIPQKTYQGAKYTIDANQHFEQSTPLKNTYFYKFYNQLYSKNNKAIATGTWNGIVPSGVKVSVELVSVSLNEEVGISNDQNLAIVYAGYGNEDAIDTALQSGVSRGGAFKLFPNPSLQYVVSGEVPWEQNRYPYQHAFNEYGQLAYTAFKSGPSEIDAINISRSVAIKKINSKILQLVNKVLPTVSYKNRKWKRLRYFKAKLDGGYFNNTFSRLFVPDTAAPGAEISRRLRPYASGQA